MRNVTMEVGLNRYSSSPYDDARNVPSAAAIRTEKPRTATRRRQRFRTCRITRSTSSRPPVNCGSLGVIPWSFRACAGQSTSRARLDNRFDTTVSPTSRQKATTSRYLPYPLAPLQVLRAERAGRGIRRLALAARPAGDGARQLLGIDRGQVGLLQIHVHGQRQQAVAPAPSRRGFRTGPARPARGNRRARPRLPARAAPTAIRPPAPPASVVTAAKPGCPARSSTWPAIVPTASAARIAARCCTTRCTNGR